MARYRQHWSKEYANTKFTNPILERIVLLFCLSLSTLVLLGWIFDLESITLLFPGGETMKFNTALVFLLSATNMWLFRQSNRLSKIAYSVLAWLVILIGTLSLVSYCGFATIGIDNLFVRDQALSVYPGRMSPATALCAVLMGLAFLGFRSKQRSLVQYTLVALKIVVLLALADLIAYILLIPSSSKTWFFQTMSLLTSILFFLLAISLILNSDKSFFNHILRSNLTGSRIFRKLLPVIVILPVFAGFLLILGINSGDISADFGIAAYTVFVIPASLIYIATIANGLNNAEQQRRDLQRELIQSNQELEQFKAGLDQVAILVKTNRKGEITSANQKFCEISQYSRSELIGNTHALVNSSYHPNDFFKDMWQTIGKGEIWVNEIKNKAKDGSFYWVHTAIIPFKDEQGKIEEYLAIRQDITQRKEAEAMKVQYLNVLENKNKELQQFAYVASHDLQEPLRTISNLTKILASKNEDKLDAAGKQSMKFIQEATDRMSKLIKSLLEYSQLDKDYEFELVDCNEILNEIIQDLGQKISDTKAQISVSSLPQIQGDRTLLRLLFQNLISNAIKFSPNDRIPVIHVDASLINNSYEFSVKDNGIGIAGEHLDKVFNIFQRLHVRSEYEGTGIGLSQCRKIVDLHQGKIWVDSKLNEGSTFCFSIPNVRS